MPEVHPDVRFMTLDKAIITLHILYFYFLAHTLQKNEIAAKNCCEYFTQYYERAITALFALISRKLHLLTSHMTIQQRTRGSYSVFNIN